MRKSGKQFESGLVWIVLAWLVFLSLVAVDRTTQGADDITVTHVRDAWQKRLESIKSFQYECRLEESIIKGSRNGIAEPFVRKPHEEIPRSDFVLRKTFIFSLSGNKIAYSQEGEQWDDASNSSRVTNLRAGFDGVYYKVLSEGVPLPLGEVAPRSNPGVLADVLTVHANQAATWLWFSPIASLQRKAYFPDKMTVSRLRAFCDGHECVELSIPRRNQSWRASICVDPARDYLPLQLVEQYEGVVKYELSIRYIRDEAVGWRIAAWNDKWFNKSGSLNRSSLCEVKRCSINTSLGDDVFTFEFPKGTHVQEHDGNGDKYFIARGDGKPQPIAASEYGSSAPQAEPVARGRVVILGLLTTAILVLVAILIWRRRRR